MLNGVQFLRSNLKKIFRVKLFFMNEWICFLPVEVLMTVDIWVAREQQRDDLCDWPWREALLHRFLLHQRKPHFEEEL